MISSTSATVPGAGGGATTEGQGEEVEEDLREEVDVEEAEGEGEVVATADASSLRRLRCLLRECDPLTAVLERRDRGAALSGVDKEVEACLRGAARRELEEDATAAEAVPTAATRRGGVIRRAAAAPLTAAAAMIPQSRPRKDTAGSLIASVEIDGNERAEALS